MTSVYDITLDMMRHVTDVLHGVATDGSATYLKDVENLVQPNAYFDRGTLWIKSGAHASKMVRVTGHANNKLTFNPLASVLCVQQVETATVVGTISGSGNATVIITAAGMPNSPKTISVAVLNLDTASDVATKIRTALNADTDIKNFFTIGGSGAEITLTTKVARANDTTMNMSIANGTCTGLTSAPTSANTTAGVAGPRYAVVKGAFPYEQILAAIQTALSEEKAYVMGEDDSLVGDGETLVFALPAGVSNVKKVKFERASVEGLLPSTHWHEEMGSLRFDDGCAPVSGDIMHVYYRKPHDEITGYDVTISNEIDREWLVLSSARELLFWAYGVYAKSSEYMIEDRLNKVLNQLKGKTARRTMDVIVKTSGGSHGGTRITY